MVTTEYARKEKKGNMSNKLEDAMHLCIFVPMHSYTHAFLHLCILHLCIIASLHYFVLVTYQNRVKGNNIKELRVCVTSHRINAQTITRLPNSHHSRVILPAIRKK